MTKKINLNMVEFFSDEDQAFDQPCIFGNRVGEHSVYCHSKKAGYRKCYYRWCSQKRHEVNYCGGYEPNPAWDTAGADEAHRLSQDISRAGPVDGWHRDGE